MDIEPVDMPVQPASAAGRALRAARERLGMSLEDIAAGDSDRGAPPLRAGGMPLRRLCRAGLCPRFRPKLCPRGWSAAAMDERLHARRGRRLFEAVGGSISAGRWKARGCAKPYRLPRDAAARNAYRLFQHASPLRRPAPSRAIIDRRSIGDALVALEGSDRAKLRQAATPLLKAALDAAAWRSNGG